MDEGGWVRVAACDELKPGGMKKVFVGDEPVVLANVDEDFLAASDICSHEYVELHDGWLEGEEVECPEHGSRFSLRSGAVINLPATKPIPAYEVKIEGGAVYLRRPSAPGRNTEKEGDRG
ncbi:MAG: non-heme iron oxygenase ferredoxin subunit [Actinomycetota bacterium]